MSSPVLCLHLNYRMLSLLKEIFTVTLPCKKILKAVEPNLYREVQIMQSIRHLSKMFLQANTNAKYFLNFYYCCLEIKHLCYFHFLPNSLICLIVRQQTNHFQSFKYLTFLFLSRTLSVFNYRSFSFFFFLAMFPIFLLKPGIFSDCSLDATSFLQWLIKRPLIGSGLVLVLSKSCIPQDSSQILKL